VYFKYKNSDVGPRVWKDIVAGPVWIPPEGTPAKDLLTRKMLNRDAGAVTAVNTDVMGPGYESAYGLVMAIHHWKRGANTFYDNQIRTHGSVDYTSIARRFSHGCHRLVNSRPCACSISCCTTGLPARGQRAAHAAPPFRLRGQAVPTTPWARVATTMS